MTFKILSLDGGGIRGVLSATLLKQVETILQDKKGKKLHEYFDLIAGTSTGSILAAGIACQMEADELIQVYEKEGKNIFLESIHSQRKWRWLGRLIGSFALYPHESGEQGLAKVLARNLIHKKLGKCPTIGEIGKLAENDQPQLLILAYDVLSRNTTWFGSGCNRWYDNIELWKICTASASAPTFFPPYQLPYNDDQYLPHIDGGVAANNPELVAIAHALWMHREQKQNKSERLDLSDIAVLSIGTGKTTCPFEYEDIKKWGLGKWVSNIPNIFLNPSAQNSPSMCKQILHSVSDDEHYLRLDFDLNERYEGERQLGRLRGLTKNPYNKYIYEETKKRKEISEDIDNPDICADLQEAAQCYLKWGKLDYVYDGQQNLDVISAINQFIDSH